jgi:hypothetical protein
MPVGLAANKAAPRYARGRLALLFAIRNSERASGEIRLGDLGLADFRHSLPGRFY